MGDDKNFDTDIYLAKFAASLEDYEHGLLKNTADFFHDMFSTGKIKGNRLLDIGTGPNIFSVISATPYCNSVILSEYESTNRDALKLWMDGSLKHSFHDLFKYILGKEKNRESIETRESKLRSKVMTVLPCDLCLKQPWTPALLPKFDIITSSLCMAAATPDYEEYKKIAVRVMSHLEPGGHLVMTGILNQTAYTVGDVSFSNCCMSVDMVKAAWVEAGLQIVTWRDKTMPIEFGNGDGMFFLCGKK